MNDPYAITRIEMVLPEVPVLNYPNRYVEINRGVGVFGHWTVTVTGGSNHSDGRHPYAIQGRIDGSLTYKDVTWLFYGRDVLYGVADLRQYDQLGVLRFRDQETEEHAPTKTVEKALIALVESTTLALLPDLFTIKNSKLADYMDALSQLRSKLNDVQRVLLDAQRAYDLWEKTT